VIVICTQRDGTDRSCEISLKSLLQFDLTARQYFRILSSGGKCSEAESAGKRSTMDSLDQSYEVSVKFCQQFDLRKLDKILIF
jgi:hypothetical protein